MQRLECVSLGHLGQPHFTLQTVYNEIDETKAARVLLEVAQSIDAIEAVARGFGLLGGPQDPSLKYIYVRVAKTAALAELYRQIKNAYLGIGALTNPYDAQEWIPHLSVASGRWTIDQAHGLIRRLETEFGPSMLPCTFLVRELQLHRMANDGTWSKIGEVMLRNPNHRLISSKHNV
jgi:2'-5' RNA ligase